MAGCGWSCGWRQDTCCKERTSGVPIAPLGTLGPLCLDNPVHKERMRLRGCICVEIWQIGTQTRCAQACMHTSTHADATLLAWKKCCAAIAGLFNPD